MATRPRKRGVSLLDDRIELLSRSTTETTSTMQVFGAVSAILALVRVSVFVLRPFVLSLNGGPTRIR